jgi:uncharacterized protein (DUF697 family)
VAAISLRKIWGAVNDARTGAARGTQLCLAGEPHDVETFARAVASGGAMAGGGAADTAAAAAGVGAASQRSPDRSREVLRTIDIASFPRSSRDLKGYSLVVLVVRPERDTPEALRAPAAVTRGAGVPLLAVLLDGGRADAGRWVASDVFFAQEVAVLHPGEPLAGSEVAASMAGLAHEHAIALAARLPALRPAVVNRVIQSAARQNGVVGAVIFIPGADMPVMTVNQIRMVLQIAAAYGERVGLERAIEILSVIGIGFGLRTIAREALDFVPGPGWVFKGGFGYTATVALGKAAARYFEEGAPLTTSRIRRLTEKLDRIPNPLSAQGSRTG